MWRYIIFVNFRLCYKCHLVAKISRKHSGLLNKPILNAEASKMRVWKYNRFKYTKKMEFFIVLTHLPYINRTSTNRNSVNVHVLSDIYWKLNFLLQNKQEQMKWNLFNKVHFRLPKTRNMNVSYKIRRNMMQFSWLPFAYENFIEWRNIFFFALWNLS